MKYIELDCEERLEENFGDIVCYVYRIRGRGRGGGYRRGRASGHGPDPSMLGGPTVQTSPVPRHQRGLPTGMTDAGESLREPCVLKGAGGPPSPTSDFGGAGGAADVAPARWTALLG